MIFSLNTTNIYLQGYSGNIYYADTQGDFVNIKEKILIIPPYKNQAKLETLRVDYTNRRFLISNEKFNYGSLSTAKSEKYL